MTAVGGDLKWKQPSKQTGECFRMLDRQKTAVTDETVSAAAIGAVLHRSIYDPGF